MKRDQLIESLGVPEGVFNGVKEVELSRSFFELIGEFVSDVKVYDLFRGRMISRLSAEKGIIIGCNHVFREGAFVSYSTSGKLTRLNGEVTVKETYNYNAIYIDQIECISYGVDEGNKKGWWIVTKSQKFFIRS